MVGNLQMLSCCERQRDDSTNYDRGLYLRDLWRSILYAV